MLQMFWLLMGIQHKIFLSEGQRRGSPKNRLYEMELLRLLAFLLE